MFFVFIGAALAVSAAISALETGGSKARAINEQSEVSRKALKVFGEQCEYTVRPYQFTPLEWAELEAVCLGKDSPCQSSHLPLVRLLSSLDQPANPNGRRLVHKQLFLRKGEESPLNQVQKLLQEQNQLLQQLNSLSEMEQLRILPRLRQIPQEVQKQLRLLLERLQ